MAMSDLGLGVIVSGDKLKILARTEEGAEDTKENINVT